MNKQLLIKYLNEANWKLSKEQMDELTECSYGGDILFKEHIKEVSPLSSSADIEEVMHEVFARCLLIGDCWTEFWNNFRDF